MIEARKHYHRVDDGPNRLLDTEIFRTDDVFEQIEYVDFYRYVDVEMSDMFAYLDERAPWVRPTDTGRSTNCRINDVGIHTHLVEQGYHNYAVPYAWDVRLGHKRRQEAIAELDDRLDPAAVETMLTAVGYRPAPRQILTAWLELGRGQDVAPTPAELRAFLGHVLPGHAIPAGLRRGRRAAHDRQRQARRPSIAPARARAPLGPGHLRVAGFAARSDARVDLGAGARAGADRRRRRLLRVGRRLARGVGDDRDAERATRPRLS